MATTSPAAAATDAAAAAAAPSAPPAAPAAAAAPMTGPPLPPPRPPRVPHPRWFILTRRTVVVLGAIAAYDLYRERAVDREFMAAAAKGTAVLEDPAAAAWRARAVRSASALPIAAAVVPFVSEAAQADWAGAIPSMVRGAGDASMLARCGGVATLGHLAATAPSAVVREAASSALIAVGRDHDVVRRALHRLDGGTLVTLALSPAISPKLFDYVGDTGRRRRRGRGSGMAIFGGRAAAAGSVDDGSGGGEQEDDLKMLNLIHGLDRRVGPSGSSAQNRLESRLDAAVRMLDLRGGAEDEEPVAFDVDEMMPTFQLAPGDDPVTAGNRLDACATTRNIVLRALGVLSSIPSNARAIARSECVAVLEKVALRAAASASDDDGTTAVSGDGQAAATAEVVVRQQHQQQQALRRSAFGRRRVRTAKDDSRDTATLTEVAKVVANVSRAGRAEARAFRRSRLLSLLSDWSASPVLKLRYEARRALMNMAEHAEAFTYADALYPLHVPKDGAAGAESKRRSWLRQLSSSSAATTSGLAREAAVDVVFVHGVDGDPFYTWRPRAADEAEYEKVDGSVWPLWLVNDLQHRAQLPVRILTVGYHTNMSTWQGQAETLASRAASLAAKLVAAGVGADGRPVVFVTHSLGGLVVKRMLTDLAGGGAGDAAAEGGDGDAAAAAAAAAAVPEVGADVVGAEVEGALAASLASSERGQALVGNTRGVIFLGTPHRGSRIQLYGERYIEYVYQPSSVVSDLRFDAPHIRALDAAFSGLFVASRGASHHAISVLSFGEAEPTQIFNAIYRSVDWVVVDEDSANPGYGRYQTLPGTNHVTVCKPENRKDPLYRAVVDLIVDVSAPPPQQREQETPAAPAAAAAAAAAAADDDGDDGDNDGDDDGGRMG